MLNFRLQHNYVCGVDISRSKISAAVGKIDKKEISEIYFETGPSKGMKQGMVYDSIELTSCVEQVLKNLINRSGINIKYVYLNISGEDIGAKHSQAIIPLAERGNKVITASDIDKVIEQAHILGSTLDEEIIGQIPYGYSIDSKCEVANPLGLYSHKLEVDLYIVCVKLATLQTLTRLVNQAGFEVKDVFFSGFAAQRAIAGNAFKQGLNIFCDIGSDITELLLFNNGMLKNIEIMPIGADSLTGEISKVLEIPFELAEDVKKSYASVQDAGLIPEDKEILIKKNNAYRPIKQRLLIETATSSSRSVSEALKNKLGQMADLKEINSLFICGRTLLLEGFMEMMETIIGIPVKQARIADQKMLKVLNNNDAVSGQKYLTYLVCLGIVLKAFDEEYPQALSGQGSVVYNPVSRFVSKFKEVYHEYF